MKKSKIFNLYYLFTILFLLLFLCIENYTFDSNNYSIYDLDSKFIQTNTVSEYKFIDGQKININLANKDVLSKLYGIGESKAKNIIEYRETMGGFYSIDEVLNVKGIGKIIFEKIKDDVCI